MNRKATGLSVHLRICAISSRAMEGKKPESTTKTSRSPIMTVEFPLTAPPCRFWCWISYTPSASLVTTPATVSAYEGAAAISKAASNSRSRCVALKPNVCVIDSSIHNLVLQGCGLRDRAFGPRKLSATLCEYPFDQRWFGESPLPHVVINAGIFGVERMASRFASGSDTFPRYGHGDGLIGISVEAPQRSVQRFGAVLDGLASTTGHGGSEKVGTSRDYVPHPRTAHRLAGDVNSTVVDGKFAAQSIDHFQRHTRAIA